MALIVILSVFNGFGNLVDSLISSFNADLKVVARQGKTFPASGFPKERILSLPGVASCAEVVEESALVRYKEKQHIVTLKGVDEAYVAASPVDTMIVDGAFTLGNGEVNHAVFGLGVAYMLELQMRDYLNPVYVYLPSRSALNPANPMEAFNMAPVLPSGIFSVQQDFDTRYVITSIGLARDLLEYTDEVTAIEIRLSERAEYENVQQQVEALLGPGFRVLNKYQQEETLYKIMRSEKWAIFLILTFILLIATFNVIGSLSMLILEKRKDLAVIWTMGGRESLLRRVFLSEGLMISLAGGLAGLALGALLCWLQQQFGLVKLHGTEGAFVISAYPVAMEWLDFITVFGTVMLIGLVATLIPVSRIRVQRFELQYL
jgi:lipoprotein-releasing system permease protein